MRKFIVFLIMIFILIQASKTFAREEQPVKVMIDREEITFNVSPGFYDGRLLVPMRSFLEALGAEISWDLKTNTVTAKRGNDTLTFRINEPYAVLNGKVQELSVPARNINGSTMVPLRFLSEFFGLHVHWDEEKRIVEVESSIFIPFERVHAWGTEINYPWIREWVENSWDELGIQIRKTEGKLYILTTYGLKHSGGYEVEVRKIERRPESLKIVVDFMEPMRNQYTIPVFSRPYDLVYVDLLETDTSSYLICFTRGLTEGQLPIRLDLNP
ncbi:MAG: stalk domain-containing protein [Bacillota bacterium]|nr:stalk domain-containing protein [Bacillota bacterium]